MNKISGNYDPKNDNSEERAIYDDASNLTQAGFVIPEIYANATVIKTFGYDFWLNNSYTLSKHDSVIDKTTEIYSTKSGIESGLNIIGTYVGSTLAYQQISIDSRAEYIGAQIGSIADLSIKTILTGD